MTQYARPASDVTDSDWVPSTGTTLWECIDEASYSDSDYITATGVQTCEVGLSSVTDPVSSSSHTARFRARATGSSAAEKMTVTLYEGSTLRATILNAGSITRSTFNEYNYTLTAGEADAITNYGDLRMRFVTTTIGASETIDVSWAVFEVPDLATAKPYNLLLLNVG